MTSWPAPIAELTPLYLTNTATVVAAMFNTTRNAVIGRMNRSGVVKRPPPMKPAPPAFDFDERRCRFPLGEPRQPGFRYCGAEVVVRVLADGRAVRDYCGEHVARMYQGRKDSER